MTHAGYLKDPEEIYRRSFAMIEEEVDLSPIPIRLHPVVTRLIHACGMSDIVCDLDWSHDIVDRTCNALCDGVPILVDSEMVKVGIIQTHLPRANHILHTLRDPQTRILAHTSKITYSAAAVEAWHPYLDKAVVVIGNAPTALFALLDMLERTSLNPAGIIAFPVGFIGAAQAKKRLAQRENIAFLTLHGRRGGSALAASALNAIALMCHS